MNIQMPPGFTQDGAAYAMSQDLQHEALNNINSELHADIERAGGLEASLNNLAGELNANGVEIQWAQDVAQEFKGEPTIYEPSYESELDMSPMGLGR